jgi:hypothetical protein
LLGLLMRLFYFFKSIFLSIKKVFSSANWAYFLINTRLFFSTMRVMEKHKLLSHF